MPTHFAQRGSVLGLLSTILRSMSVAPPMTIASESPSATPPPLACTTNARCDDGNVCTADTCDLVTGWVYTNNTNACSDLNACTADDTCTAGDQCAIGTCRAGTAVVWNDNNVCTTDTCDQATGCVFANNAIVCSDGNVCTTDACSGVCASGGTVYYYRSNLSGGSEPSTKPVPNVGIDGSQDVVADSPASGTGAYVLGSLFGNVTVSTVAKLGSPRACEHNGANTSLDASQVARFAVGAVNHFDVATATGSDWKFLRCNAYGVPGRSGLRGTGLQLHSDLAGRDRQELPRGPLRRRDRQPAACGWGIHGIARRELSRRGRRDHPRSQGRGAVPRRRAATGHRASVGHADGILGPDLVLRHDSSRIAMVGVNATGIGSALSVARADQQGSHRKAAYGYAGLSGSGSILTITVEGLNNKGRQLPPTIDGVANEGGIPLRVRGRSQTPPMRR